MKGVIKAGRVDVPIAASNSRRTWSLPSQRWVKGLYFISPTTLGPAAPPRLRMSVGFRRVVPGDDLLGDETFFLFLGKTSLTDFEGGLLGKSIVVVVRRNVLVAGVKMPVADSFRLVMVPFILRIVPCLPSEGLSPADFENGFSNDEPGIRLLWPLGCTLNRPSLSWSKGKSSKPSSSVPSP